MKIGIVSRPDLEKAAELAEEILDTLSEGEVYLAPALADMLGRDGTPVEELDFDSLITIGGDGTVLHNLQRAPNASILGINMGGRGFLADVNPEDALEAVERMVKGELDLLERVKLSVEVSGEQIGTALNEGVIRNKDPTGTTSFTFSIDGEEVERVEADGLIVSTPTGSTAYSLAAGGPIMDPKVEAFLAVPLAPLKVRVIPLIFPMSSKVKVELLDMKRNAYVTLDGQVTCEAEPGDVITFKKSDGCAKFYKWKGKFYEKIGEKL